MFSRILPKFFSDIRGRTGRFYLAAKVKVHGISPVTDSHHENF